MPGRRRIRSPCSAASRTSVRARSTPSRAGGRLAPRLASRRTGSHHGIASRGRTVRQRCARWRAAPPRPASAERGGHRHATGCLREPAEAREGIRSPAHRETTTSEARRRGGEGRRPPVVAARWSRARFRAPSVSLPRCADDLPVSAITRRPLLPHGVNSRGRGRVGHQVTLRTALRERRSPLRSNPQRGERRRPAYAPYLTSPRSSA